MPRAEPLRRAATDGRRQGMQPVPAPETGEPLTAREGEILRLFSEGFGTAEIARRLGISPVTVRNHAQRILAKLRVHSRLAAVARGYMLGLIRVLPGEESRPPG